MTAGSIVIANDTRRDRHYGCQAVMEGLIDLLRRIGLEAVGFSQVGKPWSEDTGFMRRIPDSAAIIANGEGSIHHANERARALASLGPYASREAGKPSVLLNCTLHANNQAVYDDIAAFSLLCVRDNASAEEAASFGLPRPMVCPDFSLYHDFSQLRAQVWQKGSRIGVTDSVLPAVAARLAAMQREQELVPCSIKIPAAVSAPSILDYAREVASLDFLITGRYHAVCYALNTGTPFVAVESNTNKIGSLLQDVFGSRRRLVKPAAIKAELITEFGAWTDAEQAALQRFAAHRVERFAALGEAVASTVRGGGQ